MLKDPIRSSVALLSMVLVAFTSCEDQDFADVNNDTTCVKVSTVSAEMAEVCGYVPGYAVMTYRGSTPQAPEETGSAWRWAHEMGVDYLKSDLRCTRDGVILANRDDNPKRTTNIENMYSELVPAARKAFYMCHGMSEKETEKLIAADKVSFRPHYVMSYMYEELLALDVGSWFNETSVEQARKSFTEKHQYASALEDQIRYAGNKMLKCGSDGEHIYTITDTWDPNKPQDYLTCKFEYVGGLQDIDNCPGTYIEFKESRLNPLDFEKRVYNKLDELGQDIITKPYDREPFYENNEVNVNNASSKVILQTFSLKGLRRAADEFQGRIPTCFLLWGGNDTADLKCDTPQGYAPFINLGLECKAHIIGPYTVRAPNNYPEMNAPWQAYLTEKSNMLNHPYSFDSYARIGKYFGQHNWGNTVRYDDTLRGIYNDGLSTNRPEMSLKYLTDNGPRKAPAPQTVPNAIETLERLDYQLIY